MKSFIILSFTFLISFFSCSNLEQKEEIEVNALVVSFIDEMSKSNTEEAVTKLFVTNKLISSTDQVNSVVEMYSKEISNKGRYIDFELIKKSKIGMDLEYYSILFKYEYMPIRISIVIYKSSDKWILLDFAYDSAFLDELFETGKAYRLLNNIEY